VRSADRADYADQLVLLARRFARPAAMLGMANRSDLSARVRALLDERQRRGSASALTAAAALVAACVGRHHRAGPRRGAPQDQPREQDAPRVTRDGTASATARKNRPRQRRRPRAARGGRRGGLDRHRQAAAGRRERQRQGRGGRQSAHRRGARQRLSAVKLLLDRGADPNMRRRGRWRAAHRRGARRALSVMTLLLDRGANIELVVPGDENALINASARRHLDAVKLLVARGANVNSQVWVEGPTARGRGARRYPRRAANASPTSPRSSSPPGATTRSHDHAHDFLNST
jgi:hypothetical protein